MSFLIGSTAYSSMISSAAGSKVYLPVSNASLIYSHFEHVAGVQAKKGQNGVSISKLQILNTMIDHLSKVKMEKQTSSLLSGEKKSIENIDSLIENYQSQIKQTVALAENTPYVQNMEQGILFSFEV